VRATCGLDGMGSRLAVPLTDRPAGPAHSGRPGSASPRSRPRPEAAVRPRYRADSTVPGQAGIGPEPSPKTAGGCRKRAGHLTRGSASLPLFRHGLAEQRTGVGSPSTRPVPSCRGTMDTNSPERSAWHLPAGLRARGAPARPGALWVLKAGRDGRRAATEIRRPEPYRPSLNQGLDPGREPLPEQCCSTQRRQS